MTETFCGKDCDLCQEKLSEACRGCKEGPGRRFGGDCPIAECCRDKYHANCDTCQEAMSCTNGCRFCSGFLLQVLLQDYCRRIVCHR